MSSPNHTCTPLLTVCVEDFEWDIERVQDDGLADNDLMKDAKERLAHARSMSEAEWSEFSGRVWDKFWSGCMSEAFDDARHEAMDELLAERSPNEG